MELDDEVCLCFHVSKRKVLNFIRIHKPKRPGQLADCFGAGTGCGWCRRLLERYFSEAAQAGVTTAAPDPTPSEYAKLRAQYIRAGQGKPPPGATPPPPLESCEPPPPEST